MKQSKLSLKMRSLAGILLGLSLLISFQNCSQNGFESEELASESSAEGGTSSLATQNTDKYGPDVSRKLEAMPLAYSVGFNQIAYNSCFGSALKNRASAFSFKFGAYGTGGMTVSPEARAYLNDTNNFRPIAPATSLSVGQKKSYIYDSALNRDMVLQMAWRTKDRPGWLRNNDPIPNKDYKDITMNLSDDRMLDPIVRNEGSWTQFFPFTPELKHRRLEASIFYNDDENLADFFRLDLQQGASSDGSQGMIAFAFRKEDQDPLVPYMVGNDPDGTSAYGLGYTFNFVQQKEAIQNGILSHPANVLRQIQEVNLQTGSATSAQWSCPEHLTLRIVRKEDAPTHCPEETLNAVNNATYRANLALVRNSLPPSEWDVNLSLGCAVPKAFECYAKETRNGSTIPVNYSATGECFQSHKDASHYSASNPGSILNYCAQHISICVRTQ